MRVLELVVETVVVTSEGGWGKAVEKVLPLEVMTLTRQTFNSLQRAAEN
jgi:hypothetical protein